MSRQWRRPYRVEIYATYPELSDPMIDSFVTLEDAEDWAMSETRFSDVSLVFERDISGDWIELYSYTITSEHDARLTEPSRCEYYSTGACTCPTPTLRRLKL